LNRCLDTAIAEAVTEHGRVTAERAATEELERSGEVAHEIRNMLSTANLAFAILKRGTVSINGSTGAVLGRSLTDLTVFVNSALTDIRLNAQVQRREQMSGEAFVNDLAVHARLQAEYRGVEFVFKSTCGDAAITVDPQLLTSAVTNVLNNAIKYTRPGSRVVLRVFTADARLLIEVEDECGGSSRGRPRTVPAVRAATRTRSHGLGTGTLDCPQGRAGARWRHRDAQHAGPRLRLHHRPAAGVGGRAEPPGACALGLAVLWRRAAASGLSSLKQYRMPERGARIARREERAYWA
jgi:K+-sensing histidine kinase KdpD